MDLFIRDNEGYGILEPCGGTNVYVEIKYNGTSCETLPKASFFPGLHIKYTQEKDMLGTCKDKEFDANLSEIEFEIKTKDSDNFCPGKLTFEMKNGVLFITDNITEWNVSHTGVATTNQKNVKSN